MGELQSLFSFTGLLVLLILITLFLGLQERRKTTEKLRQTLREGFGKPSSKKTLPERYAQIPQYFLHHRPGGEIDDITWNDLDLDELFHVMDSTCSASGEEYLYYLLRTPSMRAEDIVFSQQQYDWFSDSAHEEERIRLQEILSDLGHAGRYSLYDYIEFTKALGERSNIKHYIAAVLPFAAFGLMFVHTGIGIIMLIAVMAFNLITYFRDKGVIGPYFQVFNYILRLLDCARELEKADCEAVREETDKIPDLLAKFSSFRRGSVLLLGNGSGNSDLFGIILEYARILFHLDLIKFNSMLAQLRERQEEIDALLTITGRIDACISIASWRRTLPYFAVPVLQEGVSFCVEDLYHPLLAEPVSNSIETVRPILLTGSNASGKSTFLKAAALCALLSQTIGFAPAKNYSGPCYRIYTSMALRDSLQEGESYFIVEIKSLRRILQAAGNIHTEESGGRDAGPANADSVHLDSVNTSSVNDGSLNPDSGKVPNPVLCCIDEVLRGTNTVERIAASAEILRCFAKTKTLCFAATHDLELTGILEDVYDNYHFSEEIIDGDVRFSYRILPGPSTSCNAIALLNALGYDRTIVEQAQSRADAFLASGTWQQA